MCGEAVDDSLASLKLIPNWFVTNKMTKNLYTALHSNDGLLFLMKILVMSHFVVMKWVFLVYILIILTLIIILMKMILILLFLSGFWLAIVNLKKYLKKCQ